MHTHDPKEEAQILAIRQLVYARFRELLNAKGVPESLISECFSQAHDQIHSAIIPLKSIHACIYCEPGYVMDELRTKLGEPPRLRIASKHPHRGPHIGTDCPACHKTQ